MAPLIKLNYWNCILNNMHLIFKVVLYSMGEDFTSALPQAQVIKQGRSISSLSIASLRHAHRLHIISVR